MSEPNPAPRRLPSLLRWLGLGLPLLTGLLLAAHTLSDLDVWLHDRAGRDILSQGAWPRHNTYSFSAPDYPWVDHEWLFQVLVTLTGAGAPPAQRAVQWGLLRLVLTALLLVLLWREATAPGGRRGWPGPVRSATLALPAMAALTLLWVRLELRPELLSMAGFVLAARWVTATLAAAPPSPPAAAPTRARAAAARPPAASDDATPDARGQAARTGWSRWRPLFSWREPAGRTFWLTVVWAQCHGFWLLVPAVWLLAVALEPWDRRLAARRDGTHASSGRGGRARSAALSTPLGPLGPALVTLVAGILTPYHVWGLAYPFRALAQLGDGVDLRSLVAEMMPLLAAKNHLGFTMLAFKICLAWSAVWAVGTAGRVALWRLALLAAGLGATLSSQRNLGLCAVAFYLAHAGFDPSRRWLWEPVAARWRRARAAAGGSAVLPYACLALAAAGAAVWVPQVASDRFYLREGTTRLFGLDATPTEFPFAAATYVRDLGAGRPLRVANNIDAASTLVNSRAAAVLVDGRTEAYPVAVWRDYLALRGGGEAALATLAKHRVEAVVLAHPNSGAQPWLEAMWGNPQWRLAMADEVGVVFLPVAPAATGGERPPTPPGEANEPVLRAAQARFLAGLPRDGGVRAAERCLAFASLLKVAGLDAESEAVARRGLTARPDHPLLHHNLGNLLLARGDAAGAAQSFRAALRSRPGLVDSRVNLGVALFQGGDPAAAAREFAKAARQDSGRFDAWANLAQARLSLGDRTGAVAALRRAVALRPGDARLRQRLAEMGGSP